MNENNQPAQAMDVQQRNETRSPGQVETRITTVELHPSGSLAPLVRVTVDSAIALNPGFRDLIREEQDRMTERIRKLFPI